MLRSTEINPMSRPSPQNKRPPSFPPTFSIVEQVVRTWGGSIQPEEKAGAAYIVDTDIDRKDEPSVLAYLEQKYGLTRAMNMDMNLASATVAMPK
jgi:hypothetical protein